MSVGGARGEPAPDVRPPLGEGDVGLTRSVLGAKHEPGRSRAQSACHRPGDQLGVIEPEDASSPSRWDERNRVEIVGETVCPSEIGEETADRARHRASSTALELEGEPPGGLGKNDETPCPPEPIEVRASLAPSCRSGDGRPTPLADGLRHDLNLGRAVFTELAVGRRPTGDALNGSHELQQRAHGAR